MSGIRPGVSEGIRPAQFRRSVPVEPGSISRLNGMPEWKPYRYGGTGRDQLTGHLTPYELAAQIRETTERHAPLSGADLLTLMCPACWNDACEDCEHGGCKCACQDETPAQPAPAAPERCEDCGYLVTAPGHKIACGGAS